MQTYVVFTALVAAACALNLPHSNVKPRIASRLSADAGSLEHATSGIDCAVKDGTSLLFKECYDAPDTLTCITNFRENVSAICKKCFAADLATFTAAAKAQIAGLPEPEKFLECATEKTIGMLAEQYDNPLELFQCWKA